MNLLGYKAADVGDTMFTEIKSVKILWSALFLALVITIVSSQSTVYARDAPSMITLSEFIRKHDPKTDLGARQYSLTRCSAFYVMMLSVLNNENDPQSITLKKQLSSIQNRTFLVAHAIDEGGRKQKTKDLSQGYVWKTITRIVQLYSARVQEAQALTGDLFTDPIVASDGETCRALAETRWFFDEQ
jgi:hypothetical protein